MLPDNRQYLPTHQWCTIKDNIATIGITEYALTPVGEVSYVELPDVGDDVLREIPFGALEGVRATKDLLSPLDGICHEVNTRVVYNPEILKKDPYEKGWLMRLRLERPLQTDHLISAAEYQQLVKKRKR